MIYDDESSIEWKTLDAANTQLRWSLPANDLGSCECTSEHCGAQQIELTDPNLNCLPNIDVPSVRESRRMSYNKSLLNRDTGTLVFLPLRSLRLLSLTLN